MTSISIFSHLRYNFISLPYQLKQNLNVQHRCGGEGSIKKQLRRQNEMALRLASHHKIRACCAHIFTTSWIKLFCTQWVDPCLERTECSDSGRTGRDKLCLHLVHKHRVKEEVKMQKMHYIHIICGYIICRFNCRFRYNLAKISLYF